MSAARPKLLLENAGLSFHGEEAWTPARLTQRQAEPIRAAQNPTRRPNTDVLRDFVGVQATQFHEHTQIDFPVHFTEQEAALYLEPFSRLKAARKAGGVTEDASTRSWWINPHANLELRTALTRLERYLATPLNAKTPQWNWIDSHVLPDATLLAVARDDDFTFGLLQSRFFASWWRHHAPQLAPMEIVASFPFPWAPATLLSALNRTQEELRHAVARAARAGDQEQIDATVAAAYGWSIDLTDDEILAQLTKLHDA